MTPSDRYTPRCAMTIDVEDYFQVSAFEPYVDRRTWDLRPCRTPENVDRILAMLDDAGIQATFFTLGWMAQRYPGMVRRIVDQGHELASHGHGHQRVRDLQPTAFREDVLRAKHLLEDAGGVAVWGYRAPSFSITEATPWAFDILAETGHRYSSSVYPVAHDHYGMPQAPRFAHAVRPGLVEIPPTTLRWGGRNWPGSGGGYFRLLPLAVSRWMLRQVMDGEGASALFYFHPWEIDPEQPRPEGLDWKTRFRHYLNLHRNADKLQVLFRSFRWGRMDAVFLCEQQGALVPQTQPPAAVLGALPAAAPAAAGVSGTETPAVKAPTWTF